MQVKKIPQSSIAEKNSYNISRNPSFCGFFQKTGKTLIDLFEPQRAGNMGRNLFVVNAYIFLLSGRLLSSRDKKGEKIQVHKKETALDYIRKNNEKRETIIRDVPTILLAVMGVPWAQKIVSTILQKKQGFAIHDVKKEGSKIKLGDMIPEYQVKDWYVYDQRLHSGFKGFTQRLSDMGGNLKKIYSRLDHTISDKIKKFSVNNEEFMKQLFADEALAKEVESAFSNSGNKAFRHAGFLKAVPKVAGFAATLLLIGIFIPKFNIFVTEMLNRNHQKNKENEADSQNNQNTAKIIKNAHNSSPKSTKQAFASFLNNN